jgi:hypothetical protein
MAGVSTEFHAFTRFIAQLHEWFFSSRFIALHTKPDANPDCYLSKYLYVTPIGPAGRTRLAIGWRKADAFIQLRAALAAPNTFKVHVHVPQLKLGDKHFRKVSSKTMPTRESTCVSKRDPCETFL